MQNIRLCKLSQSFFEKYPEENYSEIERKPTRPYSCLVFNLFEGLYICVPFRSHIPHNNAFIFKNSLRSKTTRSGLDYSKLVVASDETDLIFNSVVVDTDEYNEARKYYKKIKSDVKNYIMTYLNFETSEFKEQEYNRKYQYSTLPYFKTILMSSIPKELVLV